jgi:hypothetical protein
VFEQAIYVVDCQIMVLHRWPVGASDGVGGAVGGRARGVVPQLAGDKEKGADYACDNKLVVGSERLAETRVWRCMIS